MQIVNEFGVIKIENEVIARVAGLAATECYGVVGMGAKSVRDGIVHLLKRESLTKGINVKVENNTVTIDLHVIVEYGTNIAAVTESLISTVMYKVKENVGIDVGAVNINVISVRI